MGGRGRGVGVGWGWGWCVCGGVGGGGGGGWVGGGVGGGGRGRRGSKGKRLHSEVLSPLHRTLETRRLWRAWLPGVRGLLSVRSTRVQIGLARTNTCGRTAASLCRHTRTRSRGRVNRGSALGGRRCVPTCGHVTARRQHPAALGPPGNLRQPPARPLPLTAARKGQRHAGLRVGVRAVIAFNLALRHALAGSVVVAGGSADGGGRVQGKRYGC